MHALVITVDIDPSRYEEAIEGLHSMVIPQVKAAPGFVSGTWGAKAGHSKGMGFMLFETEEAASAVAATASSTPPDAPVTFVSAEVLEVTGQA